MKYPKIIMMIPLLLLGSIAMGQASKGLKLLEKGEWDAALVALEEDVEDEKYKAMALYGLSKLYAIEDFEEYEPKQAYDYWLASRDAFRKLDYKTKNKQAKLLTMSIINKQKKEIIGQAYKVAEGERSLEAWNTFLATYDKPPFKIKKQAEKQRNQMAYDHALAINTYASWGDFYKQYRASVANRNSGLIRPSDEALVARWVEEGYPEDYDTFAQQFKGNYYVRDSIYYDWERFVSAKDIKNLIVFEQTHPKTLFGRRAKIDLPEMLLSSDSYGDAHEFVMAYGNTPMCNEEIWRHLYATFVAAKGGKATKDLVAFKNRYLNYPFQAELKEDILDSRKEAIEQELALLKEEGKTGNYLIFLKRYKGSKYAQAAIAQWEQQLVSHQHNQQDYEQYLVSADTSFTSVANEQKFYERWYATLSGSLEDVKKFVTQYPDKIADETINKDINVLGEQELAKVELLNSIFRYNEFIIKYEGFDIADKAVNQLGQLLLDGDYSSEHYLNYANGYPEHEQRNAVLEKYYTLNNDNYHKILDFADKYPGVIPSARIHTDLEKFEGKGKGQDYTAFKKKNRPLFEAYIERNMPDRKAFDAFKVMFYADLGARRGNEAKMAIHKYAAKFKHYADLKIMENDLAQYEFVNVRSIGSSINTRNKDEYAAVISADDQTIYFCRNDIPGGWTIDENIYSAKRRSNGEFGPAKAVSKFNDPNSNEAAEAISADGNKMYLFIDGNIKTTGKAPDGWTRARGISDAINEGAWQADVRISANGRVLLFARRKSALGTSDIYASFLEDGEWGTPFSLGNQINTDAEDRSPFLHPDMKTLYFSSARKGGYGQLDVYVTTRLDDTWQNWSKPRNLGLGINSEQADWSFKVSTNGEYAYFSGNNEGSGDVLICNLPEDYKPNKVSTIRGKLLDIKKQPVGATIIWRNLGTGEVVQATTSDPQNGEFFATIPGEGEYSYTIEQEGAFPISGNVQIQDGATDFKMDDLVVASAQEMKENKLTLPLNNLFFDTNKYNIKPSSYYELDALVDWVKKYDLSILIQGHTDSVGDEDKNLLLSENRANAVKEYLIGKGCDSSKISAEGKGEAKPIASNDTAEGRAKNRRVVIQLQ